VVRFPPATGDDPEGALVTAVCVNRSALLTKGRWMLSSRRKAPSGEFGARVVVRHLVAIGHARVLHLPDPVPAPDAVERISGWHEEPRSAIR